MCFVLFFAAYGHTSHHTRLCLCCAPQLLTRSFGLVDQSVLIPLLDLANHAHGCKHYKNIEPCGGSPSQALLSWLEEMTADDRAHLTQLMVINEQQQSKSQQPVASGDGEGACPGGGTPGTDGSSSCESAAPRTSTPAMSPAPVGSLCLVWRAGEALQAGQPVCYGYKAVLLQDVALLHYGFLQV